MRNDQSIRRERSTRRKAIVLTILFHVVLIGSLTVGSSDSLKEMLPDFIQEWFDAEAEAPNQA